jgi:hypothetical protein
MEVELDSSTQSKKPSIQFEFLTSMPLSRFCSAELNQLQRGWLESIFTLFFENDWESIFWHCTKLVRFSLLPVLVIPLTSGWTCPTSCHTSVHKKVSKKMQMFCKVVWSIEMLFHVKGPFKRVSTFNSAVGVDVSVDTCQHLRQLMLLS